MASHSSSSIMPSPSPSGSSLRSFRPYQQSVDSRSISSANSPAKLKYDQLSRPSMPQRYNTTDSSAQLVRSTSQYNRRQLSIEAVQCIFVDESQSSGTIYTFLVKPTLLQTGRSRARGKANRRADGTRLSEQISREDEEEDDDKQQTPELEPYQVEKTSKELLELSNRLVSSFDVLLDPRRGGPVPLSRDLLLPKWNVKGIFRRKKKTGVAYDAQLAEASSVPKKDVVNDFFLKVLRTGGEVLSSSRAMQDFFDRGNAPINVAQREEKTALPSRRPPRPVLSTLQLDDLPVHEATEQLTASPSWKSTPLSTPISASMSEPKLRMWKKTQPEAPLSTPTQRVMRGLLQHPSSYNDTSLRQAQSEVMMGDYDDAGSVHTNKKTTQVQLHTLMKSISQQDLRSELKSWRHEVNRASHQRTRKVSETSSLGLTLDINTSPARRLQFNHTGSPDAKSECHSAQVRQVSAVAVKAKASGWKMVKGTEATGRTTAATRGPTEQTELLNETPGRAPGSDLVRRQSSSSLAPSIRSNHQPYVPSELEKLIFGNGTQRETQAYQHYNSDVESMDDDQDMGQEAPRLSSDLNSSSSSVQSEQIASYKVKGRAAVLRLNLSGRSNLHSESMNNSAPVSKSNRPVDNSSMSVRSACSERVKIFTSTSQESWLDPDMSSSPQHTPSSAATTQSYQQYETIPLVMASDTDKSNSSEAGVDRGKNLKSLTLASRGHTSRVGGK